LGPRILILKSIGRQINFNSRWLLKDEEAIDWRRRFRSFHWARGTNSRKVMETDALLSSLLDPLEGLGMLNCEKLELGAAPDFEH
jgi:hypothetical protein